MNFKFNPYNMTIISHCVSSKFDIIKLLIDIRLKLNRNNTNKEQKQIWFQRICSKNNLIRNILYGNKISSL